MSEGSELFTNGRGSDLADAESRELDRQSKILEAVRRFQESLTNEQRTGFWHLLQEGYCTSCGTNNPRCQCWNDE